jgi:DNA-binding transcriptional ArsR family regulator
LNSDNANRALTKRVVSLLPGIHLRRLQKLLGTSFTTTRYHVASLERDGEIVRSRDRRYDRLYPVGTPEELKSVYACLHSETARRVLHLLVENPDEMTKTDISARVKLAGSTTGEYIALLEQANLVRRAFASDGRVIYGVRDAETVLPLLAVFKRNLLGVTTDNFVDLWDV